MIIIDTFELFVKFALFWGFFGMVLGMIGGFIIGVRVKKKSDIFGAHF